MASLAHAPPVAASPPRTELPHKKTTLRRVARYGVPIVVVATAAVGVARYRSAHAVEPVRYELGHVDHGPVAAKVTATGALSALVTVSVGSQVSGRIESLFADFGSTVTKGQVVAKIEPSLFQAAVDKETANYGAARAAIDRARAQLVQAEKNFAREKALFADGLTSRASLETAESSLGVARADVKSSTAAAEQAKAALDQAELNLKYTTIISPIDGTVISRSVDVGQTVAATLQAPVLFTIAQDLTRMQVDTNVAEADVGKVKPKMNVTFTVDAYPRQKFDGVVRQVRDNATTVQNVVTYDAVIDVDNTARLLKPGMTANVTFVWATRDDVVRLPNGALRFKPDPPTLAAMTRVDRSASPPKRELAADERIVWVMRGGHATGAVVRIGVSDGTVTEVLGGDVHDGDDVVVEAIPPPKGS
ncbi:MAG: efflux RND transporter periplasmic adaptor subunit [Polyangiales bacterium]